MCEMQSTTQHPNKVNSQYSIINSLVHIKYLKNSTFENRYLIEKDELLSIRSCGRGSQKINIR